MFPVVLSCLRNVKSPCVMQKADGHTVVLVSVKIVQMFGFGGKGSAKCFNYRV